MLPIIASAALALPLLRGALGSYNCTPTPPDPETIRVTELSIPPAIDSYEIGAYNDEMNPHRTGCIYQTTNLLGGGFTPDGLGIWAGIDFAGTLEESDPGSIYNSIYLVLIKADGSNFNNMDL